MGIHYPDTVCEICGSVRVERADGMFVCPDCQTTDAPVTTGVNVTMDGPATATATAPAPGVTTDDQT
jgi:uncharacterized Zn finger protein (UPF0148 family)